MANLHVMAQWDPDCTCDPNKHSWDPDRHQGICQTHKRPNVIVDSLTVDLTQLQMKLIHDTIKRSRASRGKP